MDWGSLLLQGFLLGIALSPTCLGVCLPVLLPYFSAEQRETKTNLKAFLAFLVGRLCGYAVIGVLAGWAGRDLMHLLDMPGFKASLTLLMGMILLAFSLGLSFPSWSFCRLINPALQGNKAPWVFGALTGLNICPPFLAAIYDAAQTGSLVAGGLVLVAFFAGTSLILLPLPSVGWLAQYNLLRWVGRVSAALIGGWFTLKGILQFGGY